MIIIIHGNGSSGISQKISEIRAKFDPLSTQEFSGKQTDFDQAVIGLSTGGLFAQTRLVVLDNYDEKIDLEKIPNDDQTTVVIKLNKNLAANSVLLKTAVTKKAQIFNFTEAEETKIFPFLDALAEKNPRFMKDFDSLIGEWSGQYLLTMIFYMLRRMIQDPKKLPPFVQQRIQKQKQNFPAERVTKLYKSALETDYKIKSGLMEEKIAMTLLVSEILSAPGMIKSDYEQ